MVWVHSVRGLTTPEMVPLVKEMWVELSKGFSYFSDGMTAYQMLTGDSVSTEVMEDFDFIPPPFV